uniref:Uncharacterized protein n=1 Tax=Arundo donax TaxID=35708 RepID=A0A0A8Y1B5_ARUDO
MLRMSAATPSSLNHSRAPGPVAIDESSSSSLLSGFGSRGVSSSTVPLPADFPPRMHLGGCHRGIEQRWRQKVTERRLRPGDGAGISGAAVGPVSGTHSMPWPLPTPPPPSTRFPDPPWPQAPADADASSLRTTGPGDDEPPEVRDGARPGRSAR